MEKIVSNTLCICLVLYLLGCQQETKKNPAAKSNQNRSELTVPNGFEVTVVADSIGPARHLTVHKNGDIYVKLKKSMEDGTIVALRDTTGEGRADIIKKFAVIDDIGNYHTAMNIHNGYLYFSSNLVVYRQKLTEGSLIPEAPIETVMIDDHAHGSHEHIGKPVAFDNNGKMYVPFGAPSDACQQVNRRPGSPGMDPCPQLEDHAGVWQFGADKLNQTQKDGIRYASGVRSVVALDWNTADQTLYLVQHGRDDLDRTWANIYSQWRNAVTPSEEFMRVEKNSNLGWPYCFYDPIHKKKILSPEYGGDGEKVGRCTLYDDPIVGFPGHYAPNGLKFYNANQFPDHYNEGAFIAFHGSTIREPYPQAGYFIAFVPFENGKVSGDWEVFANGFAEVDPIVNTSDAAHRPTGLAVGPDGSLYISDSVVGTIWKISFTGDKSAFGPEDLEKLKKIKQTASNIKNPDKKKDLITQANPTAGQKMYSIYCSACHQSNGKGVEGRYPTLHGTKWVNGDKKRLITLLLNGWDEPITVKGETYENNLMPAHNFLSDQEVADVATYIRQNFGNSSPPVEPKDVKDVRRFLPDKTKSH